MAIYYYIHLCVSWWWFHHGYFSCFMVILRSTTGPYGRPIAEVAYGEIVFFTPPRLYGRWAREEWLGCRHDVTHVGHTRVNTSVGSLYIVFGFSYYNNKKYIYGFQTYTLYKRTLVVSDLVLARRGSKKCFRPPICFKHIV